VVVFQANSLRPLTFCSSGTGPSLLMIAFIDWRWSALFSNSRLNVLTRTDCPVIPLETSWRTGDCMKCGRGTPWTGVWFRHNGTAPEKVENLDKSKYFRHLPKIVCDARANTLCESEVGTKRLARSKREFLNHNRKGVCQIILQRLCRPRIIK
jgi:hypothetical protein